MLNIFLKFLTAHIIQSIETLYYFKVSYSEGSGETNISSITLQYIIPGREMEKFPQLFSRRKIIILLNEF